ncbi:hypothetical protein A3Q56_00188 [Intoshia linei]|uniref:Uncharacterized protein n=1 Tax=Intoshia linei TaxID=1819745 RepID=A0A177BCI4_9BILA|nr:hypothetical protein A3Q56_00188 [Intoshia linei]
MHFQVFEIVDTDLIDYACIFDYSDTQIDKFPEESIYNRNIEYNILANGWESDRIEIENEHFIVVKRECMRIIAVSRLQHALIIVKFGQDYKVCCISPINNCKNELENSLKNDLSLIPCNRIEERYDIARDYFNKIIKLSKRYSQFFTIKSVYEAKIEEYLKKRQKQCELKALVNRLTVQKNNLEKYLKHEKDLTEKILMIKRKNLILQDDINEKILIIQKHKEVENKNLLKFDKICIDNNLTHLTDQELIRNEINEETYKLNRKNLMNEAVLLTHESKKKLKEYILNKAQIIETKENLFKKNLKKFYIQSKICKIIQNYKTLSLNNQNISIMTLFRNKILQCWQNFDKFYDDFQYIQIEKVDYSDVSRNKSISTFKCNEPCFDFKIRRNFELAMEAKNYKKAAWIAVNSTNGILRNINIMMDFCEIEDVGMNLHPAIYFANAIFQTINESKPLTQDFLIFIVETCIIKNQVDYLFNWNEAKILPLKECLLEPLTDRFIYKEKEMSKNEESILLNILINVLEKNDIQFDNIMDLCISRGNYRLVYLYTLHQMTTLNKYENFKKIYGIILKYEEIGFYKYFLKNNHHLMLDFVDYIIVNATSFILMTDIVTCTIHFLKDSTFYCCNLELYLGKDDDKSKNKPINVILRILKPYWGSGRNVTWIIGLHRYHWRFSCGKKNNIMWYH